jgi:hypothetical protein
MKLNVFRRLNLDKKNIVIAVSAGAGVIAAQVFGPSVTSLIF